MIRKYTEECYVCDNCGEIMDDDCDIYDITTKSDIRNIAPYHGDWIEDGDKHYCSDCYEIKGDDVILKTNNMVTKEPKINESETKELKQLFKCKDEVLYRCKVKFGEHFWTYGIFSHYEYVNNKTYAVVSGTCGMDITKWDFIPYEGNEHLVGTQLELESEEGIKLEEGELLIVTDFLDRLSKGLGHLKRITEIQDNCFVSSDFGESRYKYAIRFSDFNPNDMEETQKHILCVKNGKVVMLYKD